MPLRLPDVSESLCLDGVVHVLAGGVGPHRINTTLRDSLGADLAPPGATGEFLGIWRLIGDVGGVLGPVAVGLVAAAVGLTGGAWVLSVAGWLAVVTLAVLVQETRGATR